MTQSEHHLASSAVLLLGTCFLAFACVGCKTEQIEQPAKQLQVKVTGTEQVEPKDALRMKLEARLQAAVRLHGAGKHDQAAQIVREIERQAEEEGVVLSEETRRQMAAILTGAAAPPPQAAPPAVERPALPEPPPIPLSGAPIKTAGEEPTGAPAPAQPQPRPTGTEPPKSSQPAEDEQLISMNFNNVDIRVVLKTVSQITGKNFIVDENVRGNVTVISPTKIRLEEAYSVLESILEVKQCVAVPAGNMIKILPKQEAARRNVPVRVGKHPTEIPESDTIVTQVIPLHYVDVGEVTGLISASLSPGSHIASHPKTNTLIITDISSNIHRVARIIEQIDVPGAQMEVSVIPLAHASAQGMSQKITEILAKGGVAASSSPKPPTAPSGGGSPPPPTPARHGGKDTVSVIPDERTNALIIVANRRDTEAVKELIKRLDVERPLGMERVHVQYLEHGDAETVAKAVTAAVAKLGEAGTKSEIQVTADKSTNALIITASPQDYAAVREIIKKLDVPKDQVLVEMAIIEISAEKASQLGIEWATLDKPGDRLRGFASTDFDIRVEALSGTLDGFAVGAFRRGPGGITQIGAILKAFGKDADVDVLSTPHILASNNEQASITIGENIPFVKESRVTETDVQTPTVIKTYDYKDVGIIMKITPHINPNRTVRLVIDSEISKLVESALGLSTDTPTTSKRTAKTMVSVQDGHTVVIGGLMRDDKTVVVKKVPYLSALPLFGALFRSTKNTIQKTNLLIFITPYVVTRPAELAQITDQKRAESPSRKTP